MAVFEIDQATGALVRERGSFVRIEGVDEAVQQCVVACRLERGEVLLDQTRGVRYSDLVLEKGTPPGRVEGEYADQLLRVAGVTQVLAIEVTPDYATRSAQVDIEVEFSLVDLRARIPLQVSISVDFGE